MLVSVLLLTHTASEVVPDVHILLVTDVYILWVL